MVMNMHKSSKVDSTNSKYLRDIDRRYYSCGACMGTKKALIGIFGEFDKDLT
jgi:hypothetical protein